MKAKICLVPSAKDRTESRPERINWRGFVQNGPSSAIMEGVVYHPFLNCGFVPYSSGWLVGRVHEPIRSGAGLYTHCTTAICPARKEGGVENGMAKRRQIRHLHWGSFWCMPTGYDLLITNANITEKLEMTLVFLLSNKKGCKRMVSNGCGLESEAISGSHCLMWNLFWQPLELSVRWRVWDMELGPPSSWNWTPRNIFSFEWLACW